MAVGHDGDDEMSVVVAGQSMAMDSGPYFAGAGVAGPGGLRGSGQRAGRAGWLVSVWSWWGGVADR
jgi:hypothetical protein